MDNVTQDSVDRESLLEELSVGIGQKKRPLLDALPTAELCYLSLRRDLWVRYADPRRGMWLLGWEMSAVGRGERALAEIEACAPPDWTGARMLDVGCGDGGFLVAMSRRGAGAYGVDLDRFNIAGAYMRARSWQLPIAATVASATALPYPSCVFDVVTCGDVIEHVAEPLAALHEIERILQPGGYLWLAAPTRFLVANLWRDPHHGFFGISVLPRRSAAWYLARLRRTLPTLNHYEVERLPAYGTTVAALHRMGFEILAGEYRPLIALRNPDCIQTNWKRRLLTTLLAMGLRPALTAICRLTAELAWPIRVVCRKTS